MIIKQKSLLVLLAFFISIYAVRTNFIMVNGFIRYLFLIILGLSVLNISRTKLKGLTVNKIFQWLIVFIVFYFIHFNFSYDYIINDPWLLKNMVIEVIYLIILIITFTLISCHNKLNLIFFFLYSFLWITFIIEMIMYFSDFNAIHNPNFYAFHAYILIVFTHIYNLKRRKYVIAIGLSLLMVTLFSFMSRSSSLGIIIYFLVFINAKWILGSKRRIVVVSIIYSLLLFITIYYYTYFSFENSVLSDLNFTMTKGIYGRLDIWNELIIMISEKPWFGYGSNISTEYVFSSFIGRSLSSHNTFLDLIFRNGFIGFTIIIILFARMINYFYKNRDSIHASIGLSLMFSSFWMAASYEFIFFTVLSVNLFYWSIIAVLINIIESKKNRAIYFQIQDEFSKI